jgi:hypothetical protein
MKLKNQNLRELDYICTTNIGLFSTAIRWVTARKLFDLSIATHVGMLISIKGIYFVAEMVESGLKINSLQKYMNNGLLGQRIVAVRRNPIYDNKNLRMFTAMDVVNDCKKTYGYDWASCASYITKLVKDNPGKYYCSEYIGHYAKRDGGEIIKNKGARITPFEIQTASSLVDVKWC